MKKLAIQLLVLGVTLEAFGQSSFRLQNLYTVYGINAPVYDAQGTPLSGSIYRAELWGGASSNSLSPALILDAGNTRLFVPFVTSGYFFSTEGTLSIMDVTGFSSAWLQVRAWDTRLGGRYEDVITLGIGGYGESPPFLAMGGCPACLPPSPSAPLLGLQSFSLLPVVPEPGTGVLVLLGFGCVAAWRWFNRRANSS